LNAESYSKLNQIVKENIKAVLSDNKKLISVSFVALIQTINADPQMIKLIQNMPSANDSEQYKDNDINISQYFESNKGSLLDLAEKNYENLVEALTNNVINTAAVAALSSSNPTLSMPQSLSTFSNPYNQNNTFRIEDTEIYPNSKDDIAD
jgi:hypothetical protein